MSASLLPIADREAIQARYAGRLAQHGPTVAALGSGSEAKQMLRHRVLSEIGIGEGSSVLDVGCGLGHFGRYCRSQGWRIDYTGLDLVPEFVESCRAEFPEGRFAAGDLFANEGELIRAQPVHDFVVASQVFNNRYAEAENFALLERALGWMFGRCRVGVALDCLSTRVDYREERLYYFDPGRLLVLGLSLTPRVVLRHDYPLFEQTLYLYSEA